MRHQHCLEAARIWIRCGSQSFVLKPQRFVKLAPGVVVCAQSLNRTRSVSNRSVIGNRLEHCFGLSSSASIDRESVIISSYLSRSLYRHIHQYLADLIQRVNVTREVGLLSKANQFVGELYEQFVRMDRQA